jgi:hypothetical protein
MNQEKSDFCKAADENFQGGKSKTAFFILLLKVERTKRIFPNVELNVNPLHMSTLNTYICYFHCLPKNEPFKMYSAVSQFRENACNELYYKNNTTCSRIMYINEL